MKTQITFKFKEKVREFDIEILEQWMSVPMGIAHIDMNDREQSEAAFDLISSSENFLTHKEVSLLMQMSATEFARLFTVH